MNQPMHQSTNVDVNRPASAFAKDIAAAVILATILAAALISFGAAASTITTEDCVGNCAEGIAKTTPTEIDITVDAVVDVVSVTAKRESAIPSAHVCATATQARLVAQVESFNDNIKPVKEWIGYVRSPQGLAIKLVNDHVVKIPAWIGYAMDPVGSLKNKAIDEVRTRAKSAMGLDRKATADCSASINAHALAIPEPDLSSATEAAIDDSVRATSVPAAPADTNI